ncbi:MAG: class I SAM-dependent methyltransferase [Candidatus Heimdallarchaeaceae archaeon]
MKNLKIKKGSLNILDICTGPGNNLKYLKKYVGQTGKLVAMDLSEKMIEKCKKNTKRYKNPVSIQRANALALPYKDEFFDVVICSGGINLFGDKKRAIDEMLRVAKEQALIVIADEGLKPGKEETKLGKRLIKMNNLYTMKPPIELLPEGTNYELEHVYKDTFFLLKFRKPENN